MVSRLQELSDEKDEQIKRSYDRIIQEYHTKATEALNEEVTKSKKLLEAKSYLSAEELSEALRIKGIISKLSSTEDKEFILDRINISRNIKDPSIILEDIYSEGTIFTYISSDGAKGYILAPISKETKKDELRNNLESKLTGVLGVGEVISHRDPSIVDENNGVVKNVGKNNSIKFKSNKKDIGEITFYEIIPSEGEKHLGQLIDLLTNKFSKKEIQPKGFREADLTHKMIKVDYSLIEQFAGKKSKSPLQRPSKGEWTSENITEDALKKLYSLNKEYLSTFECADILGLTQSGVYQAINQKRLKYDKEIKGVKKGNPKFLSTEQIERYILEHCPKGKRWYKIDKSNE